MTLPSLIIVSGPPGSGKSTLAHAIAGALGCPAICRDEIKQGMALATPVFEPSPNDPLTVRAFTTFFAVIDLLIGAGVTVVAEAAFQDHVWRPRLERSVSLAEMRVVSCVVAADVARARILRRLEQRVPGRFAHADAAWLEEQSLGEPASAPFVPLSLAVPTLHVDTTGGYRPELEAVVAFASKRQL